MPKSHNAVQMVGVLFVGALSFVVAMGVLTPYTAEFVSMQAAVNSAGGYCGDGIVGSGEVCDKATVGCIARLPNGATTEGTCDFYCKQCVPLSDGNSSDKGGDGCTNPAGCDPVCGDGQVTGAEQCEPGQATPSCAELNLGQGTVQCDPVTCKLKTTGCSVDHCGDGQVTGNEQCDEGSSVNGTQGSCCNASCGLLSSGTECRGSAGECDLPETCNGTSAACPANRFKASSVTCRAAASTQCDVAEKCTGTSAECPADATKPASTVCRAAVGPCDVVETCGGAATCPADAFKASGTECRAKNGVCDVADVCTGSSAACPPNDFADASVVCRPATGPCDVADYCNDTSNTCPPRDAKAAAGTVCRAAVPPFPALGASLITPGIHEGTCNATGNCTTVPNRSPTLTCPPSGVLYAAGQAVSFPITYSDANGDAPYEVSALTLPTGVSGLTATINRAVSPVQIVIAGVPAGITFSGGQPATVPVSVSVTDGFAGGTASCSFNFRVRPAALCGNGVVNAGEQCDPGAPPSVPANLNNWTCYTMGAHPDFRTDCDPVTGFCRNNLNFSGGNLRCTSACRLDLSQCIGCGNARIESGESCDTTNLNGQTCQSQGFGPGGVLSCNKDRTCRYFDTSRCLPLNECRGLDYSCGDGDTRPCCGGLYCSNQRNEFGARTCKRLCGNGRVDVSNGEECDGWVQAGRTCSNIGRGYDDGVLACNNTTCRYDVSNCSTCNNGTREGPEQCDMTDLGTSNCTNIGMNFDGGDLACNDSCRFHTAQCTRCGNGIREGLEQCDGPDRGGETCSSLGLGFDDGELGCNDFCQFSTTQCSICGNNVREGSEECDGSVPPGRICVNLPDGDFSSGTLQCNNAICRFDRSACRRCDTVGNTCCTAGASRFCIGADPNGVSLSCNTFTQQCETCGVAGALCCANPSCGNNPGLVCSRSVNTEPYRCTACGGNRDVCCNAPGVRRCQSADRACSPASNSCELCGDAVGSPCCETAPNLSCSNAPNLSCNTTTRLCEACGRNTLQCCPSLNPNLQCTEGTCVGGNASGIGGTCQVCGTRDNVCCPGLTCPSNPYSVQNPTGLICDLMAPVSKCRQKTDPSVQCERRVATDYPAGSCEGFGDPGRSTPFAGNPNGSVCGSCTASTGRAPYRRYRGYCECLPPPPPADNCVLDPPRRFMDQNNVARCDPFTGGVPSNMICAGRVVTDRLTHEWTWSWIPSFWWWAWVNLPTRHTDVICELRASTCQGADTAACAPTPPNATLSNHTCRAGNMNPGASPPTQPVCCWVPNPPGPPALAYPPYALCLGVR